MAHPNNPRWTNEELLVAVQSKILKVALSKLRWFHAQDLAGTQSPVASVEFTSFFMKLQQSLKIDLKNSLE